MTRAQKAMSFGRTVPDYSLGRADYPVEVASWLVDGASSVVELAAGTGKFTKVLAELGHDVVALEPQHEMLLTLRREVLEVPVACALAEAIPVASRSAGAVVVAQAWHWFDHARALPEITRVLIGGGRLGLVWNVRDESVDWVARLARITGSENSAATRAGLDRLEGFDEFEEARCAWSQPMNRATLLAHVRSRSGVVTLDEASRERMLEEVSLLCQTHPDLQGRDLFELPYQTHAYRARLVR